ncbi:MAG: hypothetical protein U1E20_00085 [Methylocystis sp.]|uniref:hypothetical protein n=1 Tax=Methylocystis sp. TaxID=1911079 RepID=UPI003942EA91
MDATSQVTTKIHEAQDAIAKASANAAAKAASFADDENAKMDETDAALATAARQSRETAEKAKVASQGFKTSIEEAVREQPITALLLAVAGGFLVGAMWKGRS